jgi:hypothetical protein
MFVHVKWLFRLAAVNENCIVLTIFIAFLNIQLPEYPLKEVLDFTYMYVAGRAVFLTSTLLGHTFG